MVFPVVFITVFFMLFWGKAYYSKSKAEAITRRAAVAGAAYFADPALPGVARDGAPQFGESDDMPYRYLTGADLSASAAGEAFAREAEALGSGLFAGMSPLSPEYGMELTGMPIFAEVTAYLTYSTPIPVRVFGMDRFLAARVSARSHAPVPDAPEMIRNINMAEDFIAQTGADQKLKSAAECAKSLITAKP
jgi:hypothetical protein